MIRRSTLVTDGPTDRVLRHVLEWILRSAGEPLHVAQWLDPRPLPRRPADLAERVRLAVCLYPCDLLFVHRDAERTPPDDRREETRSAIDTLGEAPPAVPVIVSLRQACMTDAVRVR